MMQLIRVAILHTFIYYATQNFLDNLVQLSIKVVLSRRHPFSIRESMYFPTTKSLKKFSGLFFAHGII
jgi:hypothetical protein